MIKIVIYKKNNKDYYSLIESSTFLDVESLSTQEIPIRAIEPDNSYLISFTDIYNFSESTMRDYDDTLQLIAEEHNIPSDSFIVSIKEEDLILDPSLVDEFDSYVVESMNEQSFPYIYCATLAESYLESANEEFLNILCEDEIVNLDEVSELNQAGAK